MSIRTISFLIASFIIIATACIAPAAGPSTSRYGYINVKGAEITLSDSAALIEITYELETPAKILVLLLGKNDLKNKLFNIINYENVTVRSIDLDRATFYVEGAVIDYGDGACWFPEHRFGIMMPSLIIRTPQTTITYHYTNSVPKGIGYFKIETDANRSFSSPIHA